MRMLSLQLCRNKNSTMSASPPDFAVLRRHRRPTAVTRWMRLLGSLLFNVAEIKIRYVSSSPPDFAAAGPGR
jgi:hypothetical protein